MRPLRLRLRLVALALLVAAVPATAVEKEQQARDVAYGEALFDYYRQHSLGAMTTLSMARDAGQLPQNGHDAALLEGILAVSLNMLKDAETLFASSLQHHSSRVEVERTWLSIAAIHYRQGRPLDAHRIISTQLKNAGPSLMAEVRLLDGLSLIAAGRHEEAKAILENVEGDAILDDWSRLNLAIAQSVSGLGDKAVVTFRRIILDSRPDPDFQPLRDRAAYACAMHYFREKDWEKARHYLNRVRLDSHVAEPALLAAGWVAFNSNDKPGALTPWLTLAERNSTSLASEEVLLNIPFVYEEQGALRDALEGYRRADTSLQASKARIEAAKARVAEPDWIDRISPPPGIDENPLSDLPAFTFRPDDASPWLYRYLASHAFMSHYQGYREVQRLNHLLKRWQDALPRYRETLGDQLDAIENAARFHDKKMGMASRFRDNVMARRDRLAEASDERVRNRDDSALADSVQQKTLDRLRKLEAQLSSLPDARYAAEKARLARLRGLLAWELAEQAPRERWSLARDQARLDMAIDALEKTLASLKQAGQARNDDQQRITRTEARLAQLDKRLKTLRTECRTALINQRLFLRQEALAALSRQQVRLDQLRGYSLLSIARLQDKSIAASSRGQKTQDKAAAPVVTNPVQMPLPNKL